MRIDLLLPFLSRSPPRIAFSYSGLKNQVRLAIEDLEKPTEQDKADICASFQKIASAHILQKLKKTFKTHKFDDFAIVGGASANQYLRSQIESLCQKNRMRLHVSDLKFCSDNAAMIGRYAIDAYDREDFVQIDDIRVNPKTSF